MVALLLITVLDFALSFYVPHKSERFPMELKRCCYLLRIFDTISRLHLYRVTCITSVMPLPREILTAQPLKNQNLRELRRKWRRPLRVAALGDRPSLLLAGTLGDVTFLTRSAGAARRRSGLCFTWTLSRTGGRGGTQETVETEAADPSPAWPGGRREVIVFGRVC